MSEDSQKKVTYRKTQVAKEYILGYPAASNEDVVKATGCSPRAVTRARQYLVVTGQNQRSYFDRKHRQAGPVLDSASPTEPNEADGPITGPLDPAALAKALQNDFGPALTLDQMRQRYSAIARYGQKMNEFTLEIQAMQALARLDATTGARDRLGPGIPLTRPDKVSRVGQIAAAAGPSITAEAVVSVYEKPEFDRFVDELGRFLSKGTQNGQPASENRTPTGAEGTGEDQVPGETQPESAIGSGSAVDQGEEGPSARRDGSSPLGGSTSGQEGG